MGTRDSIDITSIDFAKDKPEAEAKYADWKERDPFPDIAPALLNSADIADYVRVTGMIFPFEETKLKPASYEIALGGEVLYWDTNGEKISIEQLDSGQEITLFKNSITYVTVNATFRLPDYIALRFNLQIEHVHKGLLLGTGPLINPGFHGSLMIPIHNLTSNNYSIKAGEDLIGVEFTKLSPSEKWNSSFQRPDNRLGVFHQNQGKKNNKKFEDFIRKSVPLGASSVLSSLHEFNNTITENQKIIEQLRADYEEQLRAADEARKTLVSHSEEIKKKAENLVYTFTAAGFIGGVILVLTTTALWRDMHEYVTGTAKEYKESLNKRLDEKAYDEIQHKLLAEIKSMRNDLDKENKTEIGKRISIDINRDRTLKIISDEIESLKRDVSNLKQSRKLK